MKKTPEEVTISNGYICLHPAGNHVDSDYPIELSRMNTHAKITNWVLHLTEKDWVTKTMIRRMIVLACRENNIDPDFHA